MQTFITSTTVTTYQHNDRLLCPPRHLFQPAAPAQPTQPAPAPAQPPVPCLAPDSYRPCPMPSQLPPGQTPFDGIDPASIRVGHIGDLLIGGITGHVNAGRFADVITDFRTNGFTQAGLKNFGAASLKAGGLSAGITAAASAVANIGAAAQGKISAKEAVSNVSTDTVGGMLSGTTAGLGAGAATLALRSLGAGGLLVTIGAAAAGALGGLGGSKLYEVTGLRERVFNAAKAFMG